MLKIESASKSLAMHICPTILIIVLLLLGAGLCPSAFATGGNDTVAMPDIPAKTPLYSTQELSFAFQEPKVISDGWSSEISVPGCEYTVEKGMPQIPVEIQVYRLPLGSSGISVELHGATWNAFKFSAPVKLVPIPIPLNAGLYEKVYGNTATPPVPQVYPAEPVRVITGAGIDPMTMTRATFAAVHVFPVKITGTGRGEWLSSGEVVLKYTPGNARPIGNSPAEHYDFLILSPDDFKTIYDGFATYKTSLGISTKVVTMNDITSGTYFPATGKDGQEMVKYFIKDAELLNN